MRPYILLIFTAVILAFFSGRYLLKFQGPMTANSSDIIEISKIKLAFQKNITPYAIVNFSSLYYSKEQLQLLNPEVAIDHFDDSTISSEKHCSLDFLKRTSSKGISKRYIWEQIRCGQRDDVPFWFFERAPYMHPAGSSYAYLLYKHQKNRSSSPRWQWVKDNLSYFHLKELRKLQIDVGPLGGIYSLLANLDEKSLLDLINREGTILTKNFLLAKISYPKSFNIMEYRFYLRDDLDRFLESTPYRVSSNESSKRCLYRDGPICWMYSTKHIFAMISSNTVISFLGVIFIIGMILWLLFSKIKEDKQEDQRRKMALQVLTHEFRTPVTSLLLTMENVMKRIDGYDEKSQHDILRMSGEIYRLQRLTEKSKHYLQGMNQKGLVGFSFETIDNLEDILYDVITPIEESHDKQVAINSENLEGSFSLDVYWIQIIVKNLIENAFIHGQGQVSVLVKKVKKCLVIEVSDEGSTSKTIEDLTTEFSKGNKSSGTGLGLSIVWKVVKEWGGTFSMRSNPTTFVLKLPNRE